MMMMKEASVTNDVALKSFARINTAISITTGAHITAYLSAIMSRSMLVLVSVVIFTALVVAHAHSGKAANSLFSPLTTGKSVMGIVATTTIMQAISDMGTSQSILPAAALDDQQQQLMLLLTSPRGGGSSHLPSVILGTCFVLLTGCMPNSFKSTNEGIAVYMGVQYAYADIVVAFAHTPEVKRCAAIASAILLPAFANPISAWMQRSGHAPTHTLVQALLFVAATFIVDSLMPVRTNSAVEDMVQGVSAAILLNAVTNHQQQQSSTISQNTYDFAATVAPFMVWRVAGRLSNLLQPYGSVQMTLVVGAVTVCVKVLQGVGALKGSVSLQAARDLLVLVAVYIVAGCVMSMTRRGSTGESVIILVAAMSVVRTIVSDFY